MRKTFDWIVVGAGFAGATCARKLAESGSTVLLLEGRDHVGGNAYDYVDQAGILVHKYGPHIFHTNSLKVWGFVNQFSEWTPYRHRVLSVLDNGTKVPLPLNFNSIKTLYPLDFDMLMDSILLEYKNSSEVSIVKLMNSKNSTNAKLGKEMFEKFYLGYTQKQWGIPASEVDISTMSRVPIRFSWNNDHFTDDFQAIPKEGYTNFFKNLLNHRLINLELSKSFEPEIMDASQKVIYTGSLDSLHKYCYGVLPYRSLEFTHKTLPLNYFQDVAQENYSMTEEYTRIVEYKRLNSINSNSTTIVYEYPKMYKKNQNLPFYPIQSETNRSLHEKYSNLTKLRFPNLISLGRLADYKYYNMDQIIARALTITHQLLNKEELF